MAIDALLFDVDGTMADTEEGHRTAFNLAFERFGLGWRWQREEYRTLLAVNGGKERLAHYIDRLPAPEAERAGLLARIPAIHAEKTRFFSSMVADGGIPLRSGIARLLDEARRAGTQVGIASTTTRMNIDALLRANWGAEARRMVDAVVCGDEAAPKKPSPRVYALVLSRLGLPASRAVAFEDSVNGLRAANAAGLWTVVTPTFWTADGDFGGAGLLLPHLGDDDAPIDGEPGKALRRAAWLTLGELRELEKARRAG